MLPAAQDGDGVVDSASPGIGAEARGPIPVTSLGA
jgi:hypothetical protein